MPPTELYLKNFRSIAEQTFTFQPGVNVIIGGNGSGKTLVLDSIAIGLSAYLGQIAGAETRSVQETDTRRVYQEEGKRTFAREPQGEVEVQLRPLPSAQRALEIARNFEKEALPLIAYFPTGRVWRWQTTGGLPKLMERPARFQGYAHCLNPPEIFDEHYLLYRQWELAYLQDAEMLLGPVVRKAVAACLEGFDDLRFDILESQLMARRGSVWLPSYLLSEGQRAICAMALDLAVRAAILNPHLGENLTAETPGVVLIDEIDLHLHPNWQRSVIGLLRQVFPQLQFILTTHSPFILQSLRPEDQVISLSSEVEAPFSNQSIEAISHDLMGVAIPNQWKLYEERVKAAKEYYTLLDSEEDIDMAELRRRKERLDALEVFFSQDPAYAGYVAFLQQQRAYVEHSEGD